MLWGILPLILHYTKSNSWIQLKGTAQGNALVAILVLLFLNPPTMSAPAPVLSVWICMADWNVWTVRML